MQILHKMRIGGIHWKSLAYAGTSLGSSMMHSLFMFYYVKIYLNRFHVSEWWFHTSQIVFMIWNAINDPLFGYIQDNFSFSWVKSRRHSILFGAPLFVISFVVPWIPWGDYSKPTTLCGLQLMFSLCFYDTMFTFVLLAQCALFTEMSHLQEDRIRLIKYSQIASLIGSSSVFFSSFFSNNLEDYDMFLITVVIIAVLSFFSISYTGRHGFTQYDIHCEVDGQLMDKNSSQPHSKEKNNGTQTREFSIWQQMMQIATQISFISFVLMNLCQIYHSTYLSNFANIICDSFIPNHVLSSRIKSIFYGTLFILPQILVILGSTFVQSVGYYKLIRLSFVLKVGMGCTLYVVGPHWWMLLIFFIVECAESGATFSLFNLCLSDVIDADLTIYKRKHPLSSMVFGTNALITKPAISLAPMLTVSVFNRYGYEDLKAATSPDVLSSAVYHELQDCMFTVTCATPIVVGLLQLIIWTLYTIRNSHLSTPKHTESL